MKLVEIGIILSVFLLFSVFGTNLLADESEANAVKVVRSYFIDALDGKQPEKIHLLFAKDAEQYFTGLPLIQGVDVIFKSTVGIGKMFTTFKTDIHDVTAKGQIVYAFFTHTATCIDSTVSGFPGGPVFLPSRGGPTLLKGQKLQWKAMARFEFNSKGQIQKEWIVRDDFGMLLTAGSLKFTSP